MPETLAIPSRFNGPRESGQGGYSSGVFAALVAGPAEVSLRSPVPLNTELETHRVGESVQVLDGGTLVAEVESVAPVGLDVPTAVGLEQARRAEERGCAPTDPRFSRCFVCGREREDSFEVFVGEVEGEPLVAATWIPPEWTAAPSGEVRPEFVWATLDCPTFFAVHIGVEQTLSFLVRQSVQVHAPIRPLEEYVVISWPIEVAERKRRAGAALLSGDGEVLATGRALLVEMLTP